MIKESSIRIFQDDEGEIPQIEGLTLAGLKSLINATKDEAGGNVVLVWLATRHDGGWFRIFIDGIYCGVDKYVDDESESDYEFDDDFIWKNYNALVKDLKIEKASVFSDEASENNFIKLEILLSNKNTIELISNKEGSCRLNAELVET